MALQIGQTFKLGSKITTGIAPGGSQYGVGAGQTVKIIGSRNVGGQQFFDIKHIGGGTGWTTAAGLTAAFSGGGAGKAPGPSPESIAAKKAFQKILSQQAGLKKEGAAIQSEYNKFVFGQETVPDLRKRLAEELGIPELAAQLEPLRKRSLQLEGLLENLPETISGIAGRESKARRDLLLASKGGELDRAIVANARAQQLFAGQVTGAQAELVAQLSAFGQQYARELSTFQTKITAFQERAARESSSFSTAVQMSLNAQLQGIQRLSDIAENALDRIHEEAMLEQKFLNDLTKLAVQNKYSTDAAARKEADKLKESKEGKLRLSEYSQAISGYVKKNTLAGKGSKASQAATAEIDWITGEFVKTWPEFASVFYSHSKALGF